MSDSPLEQIVIMAQTLVAMDDGDRKKALESLGKDTLEAVLLIIQAQSVAWHDAMTAAAQAAFEFRKPIPNPFGEVIKQWPTQNGMVQ